jgi:recombination protein RecT
MENNKLTEISKQYDLFRSNLGKYEKAVTDLLGNKYGITPQEFLIKVANAVRKTPELLKCSSQSLFGSILYFAEIGLPFNTPEGFGYITTDYVNGSLEAVPIIGYRGLIEIAYRNPRVKSIRIQAVYEGDEFDYEYGTQEYIRHKPNMKYVQERKLVAVYSIVKLDNIDPLFVVVHKGQLDELKKVSKSANSTYAKADVFNIMESKVAIKLLFKTLPKTDNEALIKALDMDNRFDYDKNVQISATENGYEVLENETKTTVLKDADVEPIIFAQNIESQIEVSKYEDKSESNETDVTIIGIDIQNKENPPINSIIENWSTSKVPLKVTTDKKVEEIEISETEEHKKETQKEEPIIEWDLDVQEKPIEIQKEVPIEQIVEIIEPIDLTKTSEKVTEKTQEKTSVKIEAKQPIQVEQKIFKPNPKTEKELFEGIIEIIEVIDLTHI